MLRYLIGTVFQRGNIDLPVATLIANVLACLIFAISISFIENKANDSGTMRVLLLTGFCGGLSTFSTFGYETWLLLKQNNYGWAFANIGISMVLCISAFLIFKK